VWLGRPGPPRADARLSGPLGIPGYEAAGLVVTSDIPDPDDPHRLLGTLVSLLDWERVTAFTHDVRRDLVAQGLAADVLLGLDDGTVIGGAHGGRLGGGWIAGSARLPPDLPGWTVVAGGPLYDPLAREPQRGSVPTLRAADRALRLLNDLRRGAVRAHRPRADGAVGRRLRTDDVNSQQRPMANFQIKELPMTNA
jgi:hypothetical protein